MRREMEYEWFVDEVIVKIEQAMDKKAVSRTELAKRLDCSPANVTQLLRQGSNLTLKSLVDIALALEHRFLAPICPYHSNCSMGESRSSLPVSCPIHQLGGGGRLDLLLMLLPKSGV